MTMMHMTAYEREVEAAQVGVRAGARVAAFAILAGSLLMSVALGVRERDRADMIAQRAHDACGVFWNWSAESGENPASFEEMNRLCVVVK